MPSCPQAFGEQTMKKSREIAITQICLAFSQAEADAQKKRQMQKQEDSQKRPSGPFLNLKQGDETPSEFIKFIQDLSVSSYAIQSTAQEKKFYDRINSRREKFLSTMMQYLKEGPLTN